MTKKHRKRTSAVPYPVEEDFELDLEDEESLCPECGKPMRVVRVIRRTDAADTIADGSADDIAGT